MLVLLKLMLRILRMRLHIGNLPYIIGYMIRANPPQNVMEGFVSRIWGKRGVDKVAMVGKGMYMVRFETMKNCINVINGDAQFFYSKPLIVRPGHLILTLQETSQKTIRLCTI